MNFVNVSDTMVGVKDGKNITNFPGIYPFFDERNKFTNIIGVGNKNGIDKNIDLLKIKKVFKGCKFVFNGRLASYLIKNWDFIVSNFDGIMGAELNKNHPKSLNMVHSSMARSMPYKGFYWEPTNEKKDFDFSILSKINDYKNKRWGRCLKLIDILCTSKLKGILITQSGDLNKVSELKQHVKSGYLKISNNIDEREFHRLHNRARVGIFPNTLDSFPKHMIESILSNKPIIFSSDLTMGKEIALEFGIKLNFDNRRSYKRVKTFLREGYKEYTTNRIKYIWKYSFESVSAFWASEINRLFKTKFKRVYMFNHYQRLKENKLI